MTRGSQLLLPGGPGRATVPAMATAVLVIIVVAISQAGTSAVYARQAAIESKRRRKGMRPGFCGKSPGT